jgi:hypothetical protein
VAVGDSQTTVSLPARAPSASWTGVRRQHRLLTPATHELAWDCGAVTYGPALAEGCSLIDGPARVR